MLNKDQQLIILSYIDKMHSRIKIYLVDHNMLNDDGTLPGNHNAIHNWFLGSIEANKYLLEGDTAWLEIDSWDTASGNPILFDFPAEEFGLNYKVEQND